MKRRYRRDLLFSRPRRLFACAASFLTTFRFSNSSRPGLRTYRDGRLGVETDMTTTTTTTIALLPSLLAKLLLPQIDIDLSSVQLERTLACANLGEINREKAALSDNLFARSTGLVVAYSPRAPLIHPIQLDLASSPLLLSFFFFSCCCYLATSL